MNDSLQTIAALADLPAAFAANAAAVAAGVDRVCNLQALLHALLRVVGGSESIVLGPDEFLPPGTMDALRQMPGVLSNPTDAQLAVADVGITAAYAGIASSGSVCIALGEPLATAASLLMPTHIVLLDVWRIVARPGDLFRADCLDGKALTRDMVLVCGPSATADMGPLVRGVHGPHRLHIVLVG